MAQARRRRPDPHRRRDRPRFDGSRAGNRARKIRRDPRHHPRRGHPAGWHHPVEKEGDRARRAGGEDPWRRNPRRPDARPAARFLRALLLDQRADPARRPGRLLLGQRLPRGLRAKPSGGPALHRHRLGTLGRNRHGRAQARPPGRTRAVPAPLAGTHRPRHHRAHGLFRHAERGNALGPGRSPVPRRRFAAARHGASRNRGHGLVEEARPAAGHARERGLPRSSPRRCAQPRRRSRRVGKDR